MPPQSRSAHRMHAVRRVREHWRGSRSAAIVVVPPGMRMAVHLAALRGPRTLLVAPNKLLMHQAADALTRCPGVCRLTRETTAAEIAAARIVVAGIHRLRRKRLPPLLRDTHRIIIDEGHHYTESSLERLRSRFPSCQQLALVTATPFRYDRRVIPGKIVYELGIPEAMRSGLTKQLVFLEVFPDYADILRMAAHLLSRSGKRARAIGTTHTAQEAQNIVAIARHHTPNLRVATLHTAMPQDERERVMEDFDQGKTDLLVECGSLREGFVHPNITVAIIFSGITTPSQFAQFVGQTLNPGPHPAAAVIGGPGVRALWEQYRQPPASSRSEPPQLDTVSPGKFCQHDYLSNARQYGTLNISKK